MSWSFVKMDEIKRPEKYSLVGGPFGSNLSRKHYVNSGVPVIRGVNLPDGERFSFKDFVWVTEEKADQLKQNTAYPGDIIFTQRGTLGQVGVIPKDSPYRRYVISQSQMKLSVNEKKADIIYVYYLFSSTKYKSLIKNLSITSGVPHINLGILKNIEIPLPPLEIQKRIAKTLSIYDDLIEINRRRIQLLEESARLLYKEWFVHLRFPGHEHTKITKGIPEGWEEATLGDFISIKHGYAFKGEFFDDNKSSRILMTPGNFDIGGGIKLEKFKYYSDEGPLEADYVLKEDDLVVTMTDLSKTSDTLGYSALIPSFNGKEFLHNQRIGRVFPIESRYFPKYFLYHFLQDHRYKSFVVGSASGTSVKHTSPKKILSYKTNLPRFETSNIIKQFDDFAFKTFSSIKNLIQQNQKLTQARDLLLPRLMNGEITI
ncbi:MAG: restriction endonuclease subunit S [Proteobacteria bacterium]|nr:restriction endonuclease subunit S [Pseudomonadota bacterium]